MYFKIKSRCTSKGNTQYYQKLPDTTMKSHGQDFSVNQQFLIINTETFFKSGPYDLSPWQKLPYSMHKNTTSGRLIFSPPPSQKGTQYKKKLSMPKQKYME